LPGAASLRVERGGQRGHVDEALEQVGRESGRRVAWAALEQIDRAFAINAKAEQIAENASIIGADIAFEINTEGGRTVFCRGIALGGYGDPRKGSIDREICVEISVGIIGRLGAILRIAVFQPQGRNRRRIKRELAEIQIIIERHFGREIDAEVRLGLEACHAWRFKVDLRNLDRVALQID